MLLHKLVDRVAEIITRYSMIEPHTRIGVGVSGGADSVVLLHVLHRLTSRLQVTLSVLHLNHRLRGDESYQDQNFVRDLAASLDCEFHSEERSVPVGNLEQEARESRRAFFFHQINEQGLAKIALGHTRSDQAETVLFRLLRGSGIAGLSGMSFQTADGVIRPLLGLSRGETRDWAAAEGIRWREDSSNGDLNFTRNRLRIVTLPALTREYNPNLEGILASTATVARSEEEYWETEISKVFSRIAQLTFLGLIFKVSDLAGLHPAVQRRLIRHSLNQIRGNLRSIDLSHVEAIIRLCYSSHGHDRVIIPGLDALRSFGTLLLTQPGRLNFADRHYRAVLVEGQELVLPGESGRLCVNSVNSDPQICANFKSERDFPSEIADIDQDMLLDGRTLRPLHVRNWEPGDEMQRPGHNSLEKLKSLFQEHKVLLWERRRWPVIVCDGEIVWARQFGCAAKFKAMESGERKLRIFYWQPAK